MDFTFTEEQDMLRTSARDFLETECNEKLVREVEDGDLGYSPELWKKIADLGWLGLTFPEQYGGAGMNIVDLTVLYEEIGRAMMPCPHLSTVVLGGMTILEAGSEEQKAEILPAIAEGERIIALALTEPESAWDIKNTWDAAGVKVAATADGDGYVIDGTKLFVHDALPADTILVAARTKTGGNPENGITLFLVDAKSPGVSITPLITIAGDKQCEVVLDKVKVPKSSIVGKVNGGWAPLYKSMQVATVMLCAQMFGAGQKLLEMSVDYAKTRIQFDMPIGINQYIQEHCVFLLRDVNGCQWSTYLAAWKLAENEPCDMEVSVAKAWSSDAYEHACWCAHQVHSGVGSTVYDGVLPLYSRRGKTLQVYMGDTAYHKEKIATMLEDWPAPERPKGPPLGLWEEKPPFWIPEWWNEFDKGT
jgi:alkylation response protein AidB-like acyl-CoA dehydrogenase